MLDAAALVPIVRVLFRSMPCVRIFDDCAAAMKQSLPGMSAAPGCCEVECREKETVNEPSDTGDSIGSIAAALSAPRKHIPDRAEPAPSDRLPAIPGAAGGTHPVVQEHAGRDRRPGVRSADGPVAVARRDCRQGGDHAPCLAVDHRRRRQSALPDGDAAQGARAGSRHDQDGHRQRLSVHRRCRCGGCRRAAIKAGAICDTRRNFRLEHDGQMWPSGGASWRAARWKGKTSFQRDAILSPVGAREARLALGTWAII